MASFNKCKEFSCDFFFIYGDNYEYVSDAQRQKFFSTPAELFRYIETEICQAYKNYKGTEFNEDGLPLRLITLQMCNTDGIIRDDPPPECNFDVSILSMTPG